MKAGNDPLGPLRDQLDVLDLDLLRQIERRAAIVQRIAEAKRADAEPGERVRFYRPEREEQMLRRLAAEHRGVLDEASVLHIFRELMSACLALEQPLSVAYLGPEGTFTQEAAMKRFGHAARLVPMQTIGEVFGEVSAGAVDYGVVPVENSTEGMVSHTLDNFLNSNLLINGEVELRVRLHLMVQQNSDAEHVSCICAHQQALAQSQRWLDRHWPNVERLSVNSNGEAARRAAELAGYAAVSSELAAELYGLKTLASNIEDRSDNTTRFLVIGQDRIAPSGHDKTSIIVSVRNQPGALFKLLEPFYRAEVMLTRIDTRPSQTENWAYVFFIEFIGHQGTPEIAELLKELEGQTVLLKRLGSYPQAAL